MKKRKLFIKKALITSLVLCAFLCSCASTSEKIVENPIIEEQIVEPAVPEPTAEEIFLQKISDYSITFTNVPAKIKKGKAFSSDFEVTVLNSNSEPVEGLEICFEYPSKKSGSSLSFENLIVLSDENGVAKLSIGTVKFAALSKVTAYPNIPDGLNISQANLIAQTAYADFKVESDITTKGAIMFVFEYTESGKPSKNSYEILSAIRKKGVTAGNAPISDTDYINASKEKIYKANYQYISDQLDMFGYLIGGTIKFSSPVEKTDEGYVAKLCADIYGIDMKTGEVIYEETTETEAFGSNWNYAVSNCKDKLIQLSVDSIMFGL
jgi:hypothetical protein